MPLPFNPPGAAFQPAMPAMPAMPAASPYPIPVAHSMAAASPAALGYAPQQQQQQPWPTHAQPQPANVQPQQPWPAHAQPQQPWPANAQQQQQQQQQQPWPAPAQPQQQQQPWPAHAQPQHPQPHAQQPAPHAQARNASPIAAPTPVQGCPHAYPVTVKTPGFGSALKLSLKVLPYGLFRFAHWSAFAAISTVMLVAVLGLGTWLTVAVNRWVGVAVIFGGLIPFALLWLPFVERKTFGTKCGHIGLLTELITRGQVGNGKQGLFAYARQIVQTRLGELSTLHDVHRATNRTLRQTTKLLDFLDDLLPIDISTVKSVIYRLVRGTSRYLDAVILSYGFARGDRNLVDAAIDGIGYCAQNGRSMFRTAIGVLVLDKVLMIPVWVGTLATVIPGVFAGTFVAQGGDLAVLTANAAAVIKAAPLPFLIAAGAALVVGGLLSLLIVRTVRESLVQPVLLTMVMLRFHSMVEGQPLDPSWADRIRGAGDGLGTLDGLRRRAT